MDLNNSEIEKIVLAEIKAGEEYANTQAQKRQNILNRYYGKPLGNERSGRSKFMSRELMETVESIMPHFLKTFAAGDTKINLTMPGKPAWVADAFLNEIYKGIDKGCYESWYVMAYEWFKDTFLGDTSHAKASWDYREEKATHDFGDLDELQMASLAQESINRSEIKLKSVTEEITEQGRLFKNVSVEETKVLKDQLKVENVPHWEYICFPDGRQVTDDTPKGHKTEVTKDYLRRIQKQYNVFSAPIDEIETLSRDHNITDDVSKTSYFEYEDLMWSDIGDHEEKRTIPFVEWYTKIDTDNDGFLEDVVCWVANDKLIGWELNPTGRTNIASMKAIIDPFKFYGLSFAGFIVEIQNLSTMLWRAILDNFSYANSGRWLVDPLSGIDIERLGNNYPGGVIVGKAEGVTDLTPAPFNPGILTLFSFVDEIRQNRGITKYTQGMDSESLNKTLGGLEKIQTAAMQKIELMERLMAETGIAHLVRNCAYLYQENLKKPFTAIVRGQETQITPDMIQGDFEVAVNMGVESSVGEKESVNIAHMADFILKLDEKYPGLLTPEKAHNLVSKFISAKGFNKQVNDFISSFDEFEQITQQQQQGAQQAQQKQEALEEASAQAQIALFNSQAQENMADPKIAFEKLKIELRKIEKDKLIKLSKIKQDEKDRRQREIESQRDFALEIFKTAGGTQPKVNSWR